MLFYEGLSCPVCKKALIDQEDLVVCPKCGLPHHRDCWSSIGHCAAQEQHDTPEQWSRDKARSNSIKGHVPPNGDPSNSQICPHCYTRNSDYADFCAHCGHALRTPEPQNNVSQQPPTVGEYTPFRSASYFNENYSSSDRIGDFSAADYAAITGNASRYYIPRFRQSEQTGRGGWNWSAFLLGPYWLLFRKQFATGIPLFVMQTVLSLVTMVLYAPVYEASTEQAMYAAVEQIMMEPFFAPVVVLTILLTVIRVLLGVRGNDLYKLHCERKIRSARNKTPDLSAAELSSVGGTSVVVAILFYVLASLVTNIFTYFTML